MVSRLRLRRSREPKIKMKVISLVPSWTETLLECGVEVIGRTRYCIHPTNDVKIVGGTKDWNFELIRSLNPDFILLDQEENKKEMFEAWPEKCVITHVERVEHLSSHLDLLARTFENQKLQDLALRWQFISDKKITARSLKDIPGILRWMNPPSEDCDRLLYIIWKNPWMAVNQDTFISSMLRHLGLGDKLSQHEKKYYEFELKDLSTNCLLLFSSEPYPFLKHSEAIGKMNFASAIIDGEFYSWFGMRSLKFLEEFK